MTSLVLGTGESSGAVCLYKLFWGLLWCPLRVQCPLVCLDLEREKLGGELNE